MMQTEPGRTGPLPPEREIPATKADLAAIHSDVVELRTRLEYMVSKEQLAELRSEPSRHLASPQLDPWIPGLVIGLVVALVQVVLFFLQRSLG